MPPSVNIFEGLENSLLGLIFMHTLFAPDEGFCLHYFYSKVRYYFFHNYAVAINKSEKSNAKVYV